MESLSLVVGTALAAAVSLSPFRLTVGVLLAILPLNFMDLSYFLERLDLSSGTTNRSALTYMQGWELIFDSFWRTTGWGLGFQQLGYGEPTRGVAADALYEMMGSDANVQDGGFVAAKVISEFGLFGLAAASIFVAYAAGAGLRLRKLSKQPLLMSPGHRLALSVVVAYSIDMFVRGIGYFTGSSALFIIASVYLLSRAGRGAAARYAFALRESKRAAARRIQDSYPESQGRRHRCIRAR